MTRRPPAAASRASSTERRQVRRRELLHAAIDVIRREGADVTMEEMATAGGISKPILYRHFADRDGLVAAITEQALEEIAEILDAKIDQARADAPPQSIRATVDAFFEYIEREPQLYRFLVDSAAKRGNMATAAFADQTAARVAETLARGLVDHGLDPAPATIWGRAIVGMVQHTATWWIGGADITRGEAVDALTDLVWVGIVGSVEGTSRVTHLFVYGTLMPGRLRWPILAPFARGHRPGVATGVLYDSGNGWPVAVFGEGGEIPGVLVELAPDRVDEALPLLDDVEDTATDMLRRIEVTTLDGTRAWTYHCPQSVEGFVAIERWADQVDG